MTATVLADIPTADLHVGDTIHVLGWVAVGSTVAAVYVLPDGTVPSLPIPASALRLGVELPEPTEPTRVPDGRPVLMSKNVAEDMSVLDRWIVTDPMGWENGTGVAIVSEAEIIAAFGPVTVSWGDADASGYFTPTITRTEVPA